MALERLKSCRNATELAAELGIHRTLLYKWRDQMEPVEDGPGPAANSGERELRKEVRELKRVLGEKALEVDFFKGALQKIEARRRSNSSSGAKASTTEIRELMPMQGSLSIERMCGLARVSRAGFYRSLQEHVPVEEDMEVRSAIQTDRAGTSAPLWVPPNHGGTASAWDAGEPQASGADHARRQLASESSRGRLW